MVEVIELACSGAIRASVETFARDEAHPVYDRWEVGEFRGRAVVVPQPF